MIEYFAIIDSFGFTYFSMSYAERFKGIEETLLNGFISALEMFVNEMFKENMAQVKIGDRGEYSISIVTREIRQEKKIFFVFFHENSFSLHDMEKISTDIYIHTKHSYIGEIFNINKPLLEAKVRKVIRKYFSD